MDSLFQVTINDAQMVTDSFLLIPIPKDANFLGKNNDSAMVYSKIYTDNGSKTNNLPYDYTDIKIARVFDVPGNESRTI